MLAFKQDEQTAARIAATVLGALLLFSPWLLGYALAPSTWSAWGLGFLILALSLSTAVDTRAWPDWANLALGLATVAAPHLLGFSDAPAALWAHTAVGLLVSFLGATVLVDWRRVSATRPDDRLTA
jgi:hypothetical protein